MKLISTILLGTVVAGGTGIASAAEWNPLPNTNGQVIYSTDVDSPAVVLGCSANGQISATFSTDGNVEEKIENKSTRRSIVDGTMTVGDDAPDTAKWTYYTRRKIAIPTDNKFSRRLYNAAVKGAPVTLDFGHRGSYTFTPPAINDAFVAFANGCSAS